MLVIAKKVGRLANRLLLFAQFIAAAAEHGFSVANPSFGPYFRYFPSTARDLLCRFPIRASLPAPPLPREMLYRLTLLAASLLAARQRRGRDVGLIRLRRDQHLDLETPEFLTPLRRHRTLFVQDWNFRGPNLCERHRDIVRDFFVPFEHHVARSRELLEPARSRGHFLVGVHIRRRDYAAFKSGRYFYTYAQYRAWMEATVRAFPDRGVAFLLCSDAPVPVAAFAGLEVQYGNGHELEDLYALAGCDRLLGPPSTYGRWASYWGAVPRFTIFDPASPLSAESFHVDTTLSPRPRPAADGVA